MLEAAQHPLTLARRYRELGQAEKTLAALADVGGDALESDEYWFLRASALRQLTRYEEAVQAAHTGLQRNPEHIGLLDVLGLTLIERGDLAGADTAFQAALRFQPQHPMLLAHHAFALARLGRFAEAQDAVDTVMAVAPDSSTALQVRAQVAYLAKDKSAPEYVEELLALEPENRAGHVLRGNLARRRREAKPAAQAYAEAAMLNPTNLSVARAARASRVMAHPMLAPSRWLLMLGRRRAQLLYLVVVIGLTAMHQQTLAYAVFAFWVVFVVVTPRLLKAHYRSKHGEL